MSPPRRPRFTSAERTELWRRFRAGESVAMIARALGRSGAGVDHIIVQHGGVAPRPRRRAARALQLAEREALSRGLAAGWSIRRIARALQRAPSSLSREVARHGGRTRYRAVVAEARAWRRARRPKRCRLATHRWLRHTVASRLAAAWSPAQISGWLRTTYPGDPTRQVSHETIYASLFVQSRGVLKRTLLTQLRRPRTVRRARRAVERRGWRIEGLSIRERPAEVADRAVPGHWEGDLLQGVRHTSVITLVERASRYVLLARVPGGHPARVVDALTRQARRLPRHLLQTLTWDRGWEMTAHQRFTVATDVQVYFCDPHSPWQRGSNENTNGLLRQYLPRTRDLSTVTQRELDRIARALNTRPRQTLGFRTPGAVLAETVAPTA